MRIIIDIGHPAHVHLFKSLALEMINRQHKVLFTCRDRKHITYLLSNYGFVFQNFGPHYSTLSGKLFGLIKNELQMINTSLHFRPDIYLSHGSILAAFASAIFRKPHIALEDTFNMEQVKLSMPFTDVVLTGDYPHVSLGKKEIRYPGYHELAYLHPKRFQPDPIVLADLKLDCGCRFAIVRFSSWDASHDIGQSGFTYSNKIKLISELAKLLKVYVSAEGMIPTGLENMTLPVSPEKIHHLLYFAHLYIGEGATMAEESSVLGTPSILLTSCNKGGLIPDLEKYDLIKFFTNSPEDQNKAIQLAITYARSDSIKQVHRDNTQSMLADKIDVTSFLTWFVEEYPDSKIKVQSGKLDFASFR